jgi:hypothetical protein
VEVVGDNGLVAIAQLNGEVFVQLESHTARSGSKDSSRASSAA